MDPNDPATVAATIIDCQGTKADPHRGFYIHRYEKRTTIVEGLTITGGYANIDHGGGIRVSHGSPTIQRCIIRGNHAVYVGGGVLCEYNSPAAIIDCQVVANTAGTSGGGIWCKGADTAIVGCIVSGNSADHGGGVCFTIESSQRLPSMRDCLLVGNTARQGGGLFITGFQGRTPIDQCTIARNTASEGGGVCCEATDPELSNCILWSNAATQGPEIALTGPKPVSNSLASCTVRYCDVRGGAGGVYVTPQSRLDWGVGNIDNDPLFRDSASDDYHLKSQAGRWEPGSGSWVIDEVTSPCIDAGDPNSPVGDEPEPNGGRINMGAYGGTAEASKSYTGK